MKKLFLVLAILMMPLLGQAKIKALVVGCVDYRLASDDLPKFIKEMNLVEQADLITIPGASLAGVYQTKAKDLNDLRPSFYDMLDFLKKVHEFEWVYVVDHRDCGMYKYVYKDKFAKGRADETCQHETNMKALKKILEERGLKTKFFLMDIDGSYEELLT